ncbi:MAG: hypothetical protein KH230_09075 [Enterocloster asparagiformis]|nr:hypothetical protein [Enterocloster asparagiformis]
MELNVNSPAYFTERFGVDDQVYRMCQQTYEYLREREYSQTLHVIGIMTVAAPEELYENGTWSEGLRFLDNKNTAAIRVKLDFARYRDGDSAVRVRIMREAILRAVKKVKAKGKFAYEEFERDLHEFWGDSPVPVVGGVYSMYVDELGKYGAYQVLEAEKDSVLYVVLDYLGDEPPKGEEIASLKPLYQERFRSHHKLDMKYISNGRVPMDYILAGVCPPAASGRCNVFSGDWGDGREYVYEYDWSQADQEERAQYKRYINSGDMVEVGKERFRKNYGGLNMRLYQAAGGDLPIHQFPCLTFVEIEGPCPEVTGWIAGRSLIRTFRWKAPETEVLDFRGTNIRFLELDATGVKTLYLPEHARRLELTGKLDSELRIVGCPGEGTACSGRGIDVTLSLGASKLAAYGLGENGIKVGALCLTQIGELDLEAVAEFFGQITSLTLRGKPGVLTNFGALEKLRGLRTLAIQDLFGYGEEETAVLERLFGLRRLWMDSVPREAGAAARKRFKNRLDSLDIRKLRADGWMKENLDNPFRHWDGSDFVPAAAFRKASAQYQATRRLLQQAASRGELEQAVRDYGECFNRLNRRYEEFIETEEREDVFSALERLYREELGSGAPMGLEEFLGILDGVRDDW